MDQFTFVRDGRFYHADLQTVEVLRAVQQWDEGSARNLAHEVFARGLETGRIAEGPARGLNQTTGQHQTSSQAAVHDQTGSPAPSAQRATGHGFEIG